MHLLSINNIDKSVLKCVEKMLAWEPNNRMTFEEIKNRFS